MGLKAIVRNGRLEIDEPVALPEGTVLDLVVDDGGDDLDDNDRAALHRELDLALHEADRGEAIPAEKVLAALRSKDA